MAELEWFEEWFESPLYEFLYADRNEAEAARLARLIQEILPIERYPDLLDLGCGRGRHSLALAERGYRVTGLDLSEEAIRKARARAAERGLNRVTFLNGDMREPLPLTFDAILNLFTSFGYFDQDEENQRVIAGVRKMLRPEGVLFMDFMNATRVRATYEPEGSGAFRGVRYTIRRFIHEDSIHKEITFEGLLPDGPRTYVEKVKLYDLAWFEKAFIRHGLRLEGTYGGYNGEPYHSMNSSRLVMVATLSE